MVSTSVSVEEESYLFGLVGFWLFSVSVPEQALLQSLRSQEQTRLGIVPV